MATFRPPPVVPPEGVRFIPPVPKPDGELAPKVAHLTPEEIAYWLRTNSLTNLCTVRDHLLRHNIEFMCHLAPLIIAEQ